MRQVLISISLLFTSLFAVIDNEALYANHQAIMDTIPVSLPAHFTDDYGIKYSITENLWIQEPSAKYHILWWDKEKQYLIAKNDAKNKSDAGLYTRIDYMQFKGMEPYTWGFCLSVYNAATDSIAAYGPNKTDRSNPRKGCNGFPFSRMKRTE